MKRRRLVTAGCSTVYRETHVVSHLNETYLDASEGIAPAQFLIHVLSVVLTNSDEEFVLIVHEREVFSNSLMKEPTQQKRDRQLTEGLNTTSK